MKPNPFNRHKFLKTAHFEVSSSSKQEKSGFEKRLWDRFLPGSCPCYPSRHCFVTLSSMYSHHAPSLSKLWFFSFAPPRMKKTPVLRHVRRFNWFMHRWDWVGNDREGKPWQRVMGQTCHESGLRGNRSWGLFLKAFLKAMVFQLVTVKNFKINGFEKIR